MTRPTPLRLATFAALALAACCTVTPARAADAESTPKPRPATRREERFQQRDPAQRLEMFRKSLEELDLTDDQKTKVNGLVDHAKEALAKAGPAPADGPPSREVMQQRIEITRDLRDKLAAVLTPDQRQKLEQKFMASMRPGGPTTQPGSGTPGAAGGGYLLQRLKDNADKLGLTDDQKKEVEKLAADARDKAQQIMSDAGGDRDQARRQMAELLRGTMEQIRDVLTPEQQQKMRQLFEQGGGERGNFRRPAAASPTVPSKGDGDEMMMDGRPGSKSAKADKPKRTVVEPTTRAAAVDPATVEFKRLDGKAVPISSFKGKPLVLVFGSYSSPTFREHAKAIDELQHKYATKANFLLVYTREAHPVGGWEVQRNKDAEINVQPHKDEAARVAAAKQARTTLGLSLPTAVDSMDDQLATTFDVFPNGCVILDREGKITARQKWADARAIRTALDGLNPAKAPTSQAAAE